MIENERIAVLETLIKRIDGKLDDINSMLREHMSEDKNSFEDLRSKIWKFQGVIMGILFLGGFFATLIKDFLI